MPSTVEKCVKELLEKTGKGDLKPIKHLSTANKLQVFNVMFKEHETCSFFSKKIEKPAGFTILDILEDSGSSSAPETVSSKPINLHHYGGHDMQVAANVDVNRKLEVSASCETAEVQKFALQFQYTEIPKKTWTELLKRKLLEKEPSFLQQLRRKKANLYVVTAIMKLTKCTSLNAKENVKGEGKLSFPLISYLKGNFKGEGRKVPKDKMDLPEDTVIAYQRKQLVFKEDGWDILYYSTDDEEETFQDLPKMSECCRSLIETKAYDWSGDIVPIDFNLLQEEICNQMKALDSVPRKRRDTLFHSILAMLKDGEDFQNLMDLLKENCSGHLEGHGGTILNELQKNYEDPEAIPVHCILYLLEAIMVLTDIQHDLLAQSMERKILAQQRELVALNNNFGFIIGHLTAPTGIPSLPMESFNIAIEASFGSLYQQELVDIQSLPQISSDQELRTLKGGVQAALTAVKSILQPNFKCARHIPFTLKPELLAALPDEELDITYGLLEECGLTMEPPNPRSTWDVEAKQPLCSLYGTLSLLQQLVDP